MKYSKCRADRKHYLKCAGLTVEFDKIVIGAYMTIDIDFYLKGKKVAHTDCEDYKLKCLTGYDNYNFYMEYTLVKKRKYAPDWMTFAEASEIWGLGESTLRSTIRSNRLDEGMDYRKSGKVWLITEDAMLKAYGEPETLQK